ncbi:MAG: hypothetical protein A2W33_01900 [Chloroflexi bacterium RBG_16_52_11]|nr:MAG: hypothetical protein A2W33_01900 [Chloroflexi bacterium RBG_16_52_11]
MVENEKKRRFRVDWLIYILAAAGLVGLLIWSTRGELSRNPSREATADLGPNGFVTIRFSTSPYPPLPTGTVNLSFMPMDSRGRTVAIDSLTYEYGPAGSDQPVGSGIAKPMADNSGMLMAGARFPSVGDWWLRARVTLGGAQGDVRFTFYVEPAQ